MIDYWHFGSLVMLITTSCFERHEASWGSKTVCWHLKNDSETYALIIDSMKWSVDYSTRL